MKQSSLQYRYWVAVCFCCTVGTGFAQTPVINLDSVAEATPPNIELQSLEETVTDRPYPIFTPPSYSAGQQSYAIADVPRPRGEGIFGYVSDPNDDIDAAAELRLNQLLYDLEEKSSVEVAVVMLPSTGEEVPKDFAVELFAKWGIGKNDTDNGLLILTVMDQRRTEFEVGYGLEPILTDVVCYRIGVNEIVPYFKQGDYGGGLLSAVRRIKEFLENPAAIEEVYGYGVAYEEESSYNFGKGTLFLLLYTLICFVFGFRYYGSAYDIERSKDDYYDKYHRLHKLKFGCLHFLFPLPLLFFSKMVEKRLKRYRYGPRFSKINGKPLVLKNDYDEIDYLKEVELLEESLKALEYDVWVTEDESDLMVLEYEGANGRKYSDCEECSYKTYGKLKSIVTKTATYSHEGERIDYYECRNCNYKNEKVVVLAQKVSESSSSSSSGSSSYSSSSSSSSSSFGGGSSGGGGAGVSW
ncbi:hypothetical protein FGM00_07010 [Aggregatimonas sangjinii]|uniref:TPM domain-containing protein n=1 Tax=Aggregatimonas sangjinii TaxID=2583587 RepID=A0A5B7SR74_9FLAO|nr:TPM domain-containing protein [Aggregatimonas sangjinii]QCW99858.1 hypothetical protein FGM00_07010 [Aggregatimonas sangjinii]